MIQILKSNLDYGNIILQGNLQTKSFFLLNQAELYKKSNFYLQKILLDFSKNKNFLFLKKKKKGKIYEIPKIWNQLKYVYQTLKIFIKNLFFYKYDFKLAIFKNNNINSPIIFKNKKSKFLLLQFY